MDRIEIVLPWPPSVNHYWRHPTRGKLAGRHLISVEGRRYREVVLYEVLCSPHRPKFPLRGDLVMEIELRPPDLRKRDVDNSLKAILDSLCEAGVYIDDSQISDLRIFRSFLHRPNGQVHVTLRKA